MNIMRKFQRIFEDMNIRINKFFLNGSIIKTIFSIFLGEAIDDDFDDEEEEEEEEEDDNSSDEPGTSQKNLGGVKPNDCPQQ